MNIIIILQPSNFNVFLHSYFLQCINLDKVWFMLYPYYIISRKNKKKHIVLNVSLFLFANITSWKCKIRSLYLLSVKICNKLFSLIHILRYTCSCAITRNKVYSTLNSANNFFLRVCKLRRFWQEHPYKATNFKTLFTTIKFLISVLLYISNLLSLLSLLSVISINQYIFNPYKTIDILFYKNNFFCS